MKKQLNIPQGGTKAKSSSGVSSPSGAPRASPASQAAKPSSSQTTRPAPQVARPGSSSASRPGQTNMVKLTAGSAPLKTTAKKQETKSQPKPAGDQEVICIDID